MIHSIQRVAALVLADAARKAPLEFDKKGQSVVVDGVEVELRFKVVKQAFEGFVLRCYGVAAGASRVVGSLVAHQWSNDCSVYTAGVVDEYQRNGIATALYRKAAEIARDRYHGKELHSEDYQSSREAKAFWRSEVQKGVAERGTDRFGKGYFYYPLPLRW